MENIFNHSFFLALLILIVIGYFFIKYLPKFILPKVEEKWHTWLTIAFFIPPFIVVFFFTMQGTFDATFFTVFSCFLLIPKTIDYYKTIPGYHHKKYVPFLLFILTVLVIGLIRFGAEWLIKQPYQVENTFWGLFNWTSKTGWSKQDFPLTAIRSLIGGFVFGGLFFFFFDYNFNTKRKKRQTEEARLQAELSQVQLESLYAQINPDFLHHSLSNIADLALKDGALTREKALELSHYFRYCINKEKRDMVSPEEETDMTKTFMAFEQQSYAGQLDYNIELTTHDISTLIPRLLLQTLAEISIREAQKNNIPNLFITIEVQHLPNGISILLQDNGAPFPEDFASGESLSLLRKKLDLTIPDGYQLTISNSPRKEIKIILKNKE